MGWGPFEKGHLLRPNRQLRFAGGERCASDGDARFEIGEKGLAIQLRGLRPPVFLRDQILSCDGDSWSAAAEGCCEIGRGKFADVCLLHDEQCERALAVGSSLKPLKAASHVGQSALEAGSWPRQQGLTE